MSKKANQRAYEGYYAPGDTQAHLKFQVTESYKTIRTNLLFSVLKNGCKRIVFSSSLPGEGKSTVSVNTAISLAQANSRVLLIDADLRKPTIHRFFNIPNTPGMTNLLGGMNQLEQVILSTRYPTLKLMCSGTSIPNPSELLASTQLQELLATIEDDYDYIIFDTPPLNIVSDAVPLIKNSDGVVLVVREMVSNFNELDKAIDGLRMIDAKILGFVYNGVGTDRFAAKTFSYAYDKKN